MTDAGFFGIATVIATLMGPILAVQAQRYLELRRDRHNTKFSVFRTLMATRAMKAASLEHIQALNLIQITFNNQSEREIVRLWRQYFDFLCQPIPVPEDRPGNIMWAETANQHLANLLIAMGKQLGFTELDAVELKRGAYHPQGQQEEGMARVTLLKNFARLSAGSAFPMNVTGFPVSEDALKKQSEVHDAILAVLDGRKPIKVHVEPRYE